MQISLQFWEALILALTTLLVGSGTGGLVYAYVNRANVRAQLAAEREKLTEQLAVEREKFRSEALEVARKHVNNQWMILVDRLEARNAKQMGLIEKQDVQIDDLQKRARDLQAGQHQANLDLAEAKSEIVILQKKNEQLQIRNDGLQQKVRNLEAKFSGGC